MLCPLVLYSEQKKLVQIENILTWQWLIENSWSDFDKSEHIYHGGNTGKPHLNMEINHGVDTLSKVFGYCIACFLHSKSLNLIKSL